jgi:hypothetical protein
VCDPRDRRFRGSPRYRHAGDLHFVIRNPRLPRMRPLPITVSTLWWSALTTLAFSYAAYVDVARGEGLPGVGILAVLFFLTCLILWLLRSYWHGQVWARTFVFIGVILKADFYLRQAAHFYHTEEHIAGFFFFVGVVDFVFSAYIFYWLITKESRRYFTSQTRTN